MALKAQLTAIVALNTSAFTKGIRSVEASVASMVKGAAKIGSAALGIGALFTTGAIGVGIKDAVELGTALFDAAKKTGVATDALGGLKFAAEETGGSFAGVVKALAFLRRAAAAGISKPTGSQAEAAKALGVELTDAAGKMRPLDAILADIADGVSKATDEDFALAQAQKLLGKSSTDLVPLLRMGSAGIKDFQSRAKALGIALDDDTATSFKHLSEAVQNFEEALKGVFARLARKITPILTQATDLLTKALISPEAAASVDRFGEILASWLKKSVLFAIDLYGWLRKAKDVLQILGIIAVATWKGLRENNPFADQMLQDSIKALGWAFNDLANFADGVFQRMANSFVDAFKAVAPALLTLFGAIFGTIAEAGLQAIQRKAIGGRIEQLQGFNKALSAANDILRNQEKAGLPPINGSREADRGVITHNEKAIHGNLFEIGEWQKKLDALNVSASDVGIEFGKSLGEAGRKFTDEIKHPFEINTTLSEEFDALTGNLKRRFNGIVDEAKKLKILSPEELAKVKELEADLAAVDGDVAGIKEKLSQPLFSGLIPGANALQFQPMMGAMQVAPQSLNEFNDLFASIKQKFTDSVSGIKSGFDFSGLRNAVGLPNQTDVTKSLNVSWVASGFQDTQASIADAAKQTAGNTGKMVDKLDDVTTAIENLELEGAF